MRSKLFINAKKNLNDLRQWWYLTYHFDVDGLIHERETMVGHERSMFFFAYKVDKLKIKISHTRIADKHYVIVFSPVRIVFNARSRFPEIIDIKIKH